MFKTAIIGLGKIASQYFGDKNMIQNIKYATHLQVLQENGHYDLVCAVDKSKKACDYAKSNWKIKEIVSKVEDIENKKEIEILVLATPPDFRLEVIDFFPSLIGIIVEKPLGKTYKASKQFLDLHAFRFLTFFGSFRAQIRPENLCRAA